MDSQAAEDTMKSSLVVLLWHWPSPYACLVQVLSSSAFRDCPDLPWLHYLIAFIVHVYVQSIFHIAVCARVAQYMVLWFMYCGPVGVGCIDSLRSDCC